MNFWKWYIPDNDCTDVLTLNTKSVFFLYWCCGTLFPETWLEKGLWATIDSITYSGHLSSLCSCISYSTFIFLFIQFHFLFWTFIYRHILYHHQMKLAFIVAFYLFWLYLCTLYIFFNFAIIFAYWFFSNDKFYMLYAICSSLCILRLKTLSFYNFILHIQYHLWYYQTLHWLSMSIFLSHKNEWICSDQTK